MLQDHKNILIQICEKNGFLESIIKQLYPQVSIHSNKIPKQGSAYSVYIIESDSEKEIKEYIKAFGRCISKVVFIVSDDLEIPDVKCHNTYFLKKPFRISNLHQILDFKKENLKLNDCIIDDKSKSIIVMDDTGVKEKIRLTNKEFEIICFIAEASSPVLKKDILKTVFGYSELSNTNTVEVHLHRLKQKMSVHIDILKYIKE